MLNLSLVALVIGAAISFVNGANDVSKGIATLAGSGLTNYRRAILWGALWTTAGSLAAFGFAGAMVSTFSRSLLSPETAPTLSAGIATILGAAVWVSFATRYGLPVSTTHAIVGSIAGVATIAYGFAGMRWTLLGTKVALPLLLSPVVALILTKIVIKLWKGVAKPHGADCLCVEVMSQSPALATAYGLETEAHNLPRIELGACRQADCEQTHPAALRITFDHLHWFTSGATSFARGLNDAPKMVALLLSVTALSARLSASSLSSYLLISMGILTGSLAGGRRVTTVMAEKITSINHREGFIANLVTASLVGPGAALGLPMSTTHVASGAIIGIGLQKEGRLNWHTVKEMVFAWVVTLPAAALLGIIAYELLRGLGVA